MWNCNGRKVLVSIVNLSLIHILNIGLKKTKKGYEVGSWEQGAVSYTHLDVYKRQDREPALNFVSF